MKILILTQYFPPEVGVLQNRLFELALRLIKSNVDITVLTAIPTYPSMEIHQEYQGKKYWLENIDEIPVHRSSIYVTISKGIVKRLLNYFSFVRSSYFVGRSKLAYLLEAFLYKKSILVTGQTQGIVKEINKRFPGVDTFWLPNVVDINLFNADEIISDWRHNNGFYSSGLIFFYGGIIDHAQGLEAILNAANRLKNKKDIKFVLLGSGPEKEKLIQQKNDQGLENVFFVDLVPKPEIPQIVKAIDVALIPLKNLELCKGAIPSKILESLAMKKTILLGVYGEARKLFINKGESGLYFTPKDDIELVTQIEKIYMDRSLIETLGENRRRYVSENFNRNIIANKFKEKLTQL